MDQISSLSKAPQSTFRGPMIPGTSPVRQGARHGTNTRAAPHRSQSAVPRHGIRFVAGLFFAVSNSTRSLYQKMPRWKWWQGASMSEKRGRGRPRFQPTMRSTCFSAQSSRRPHRVTSGNRREPGWPLPTRICQSVPMEPAQLCVWCWPDRARAHCEAIRRLTGLLITPRSALPVPRHHRPQCRGTARCSRVGEYAGVDYFLKWA